MTHELNAVIKLWEDERGVLSNGRYRPDFDRYFGNDSECAYLYYAIV